MASRCMGFKQKAQGGGQRSMLAVLPTQGEEHRSPTPCPCPWTLYRKKT